MARVTVEDCVDKIPNRFELVLLAAHRARSIANGSAITVNPDDDKNPVIALREIAERTISPDDMKEGLINSIQKNTEVDEPEAVAAPLAARRAARADARPRRPFQRYAGRRYDRRAASARSGEHDAARALGEYRLERRPARSRPRPA